MTHRPAQRLTSKQVADALLPFDIILGEEQLDAISGYVDILLMWNQSVSITSLEDAEQIVARHFGESIFAASIVPMESGRLADVGSGGGFPGLALKIARPDLDVLLVEANARKCAFLNEVIGVLHLSGVRVARSRYQDLSLEARSLDFVCSRALGDYSRLLSWARGILNSDGRIVLWLGTDDSIRVGRNSGWIWDVPTRIPESRRRVILSGRTLHD